MARLRKCEVIYDTGVKMLTETPACGKSRAGQAAEAAPFKRGERVGLLAG